MADDYYVYMLIDPRDGKPFYVGKGRGERMRQHIGEWRRSGPGSEGGKLHRIGEIIGAGFAVKGAVLKKGLKEHAAFKLERALIKHLKGLTNRRSGDYTAHARQLDDVRRLRKGWLLPGPWLRSFVRHEARLPSEDEMDTYTQVFLETMEFARSCEDGINASA